MEATVKELGKSGVLLALEDSMAAAQARRQNGQLVAEIDTLQKENEKLKAAMARQAGEIRRLKRTVKRYQAQHLEAYRKYIAGETETEDERIRKITRYMVVFAAGMISIMAMTMMVMVLL